MAALYADFGDVQNDNFHQWWSDGDRGVNLFAEQPLAVKFGELASAAEWPTTWDREAVMVVAVPLTMSKRALKGAFAALLDKRHKGHKVGRPSMSKKTEGSTARYKLTASLGIHHLKTALAVYDLWVLNNAKPKAEQKPLWELGAAAGVNPTAAKLAISDHKADRLSGRNVLAATVSRYLREAKAIVSGTALGRFPSVK